MTKIDPIYVGSDATGKLLEYVSAKALKRFAIVADTNTYKALGQRAEAALKDKGYDVTTVVLDDAEIHADEHQLIKTLIGAPLGELTFVAVGSGSITDITRFVSYRTGRSFIGMPTAPSVDWRAHHFGGSQNHVDLPSADCSVRGYRYAGERAAAPDRRRIWRYDWQIYLAGGLENWQPRVGRTV
jgi:hypothetical protein